MSIQFGCSCGAILRVADELAGKFVACPNCATKCRVPEGDENAASPTAARDQTRVIDQEPPLILGIPAYHPGTDPDNADLFMPAPAEIGALRSSHTSLLKTTNPKPLWLGLLMGLTASAGVATVAAVTIGIRFPPPLIDGIVFFTLAFDMVIIIPVVAFYFTRFRHYCGFVGDRGFAFFTCSGRRDRIKVGQVCLFHDAEELRVKTTHHYETGGYTGTTYRFSWTDESGKEAFTIDGTHRGLHRMPRDHDKYRFALAAEEAWSAHLLAKIIPQLQAGTSYKFRLGRRDGICIEKDYLELARKGTVQRFYQDDLMEVSVNEGKIALKEPSAKEGWFTSTGVHYFSFAELANARVFLLLLERLYGVASTA